MKTRLIIAACVLMATISFAQNQEITEIEVIAPKFHNELYNSVNDFLNNNVEFPSETKNAGLQGTEIVQFVVTADGQIKEYEIVNSVSTDVDNEVIRILEATNGKWEPGTVNGNPVEMKTEVLVSFFLSSEEDLIKAAKNYRKKADKMMLVKNNPKKALRNYDQGLVLLPFEESLLAMRSLCHYEMGNMDKAEKDWNRLKSISKNYNNEFKSVNFEEFVAQYTERNK